MNQQVVNLKDGESIVVTSGDKPVVIESVDGKVKVHDKPVVLNLTLTPFEASTLRKIFGSIGGSPNSGHPRKVADKVYAALANLGVTSSLFDKVADLKGGLTLSKKGF